MTMKTTRHTPWKRSGTDVILKTTTDKVGIGTTGPGAKLEVDTGANRNVLIGNSAASSGWNFLSINGNLTDAGGTGFIGGLTGNDDLYMHSADDMFFRTGGANVRMTILNAGNVGIGTTGPFTKLTLPSVSSGNGYLAWDTSGDAASRRWWMGNDIITYGDFGIRTETTKGSASPDLTRLYIKADGNVGIGTTSPGSYKLNVNGYFKSNSITESTFYPYTVSIVEGTNAGNMYFQQGSTAGYVTEIHLGGRSHANAGIQFDTRSVERMRIDDATGNVGIGTTSPGHLLNVHSTGNTSVSFTTSSIGTPGTTISQMFGYTDSTYQKGAIIYEGQDANGRGKMYFAMDSGADSSNAGVAEARMTINYDGNVGIGTTSPNTKLDVQGGQTVNTTTVNAATYDLLITDYILNVTYTGTGAVTSLTLPTAQVADGRFIIIKDAGGNANTNNITIDTEGAETIDGAATLVMNVNYQRYSLYCDGTNWYII